MVSFLSSCVQNTETYTCFISVPSCSVILHEVCVQLSVAAQVKAQLRRHLLGRPAARTPTPRSRRPLGHGTVILTPLRDKDRFRISYHATNIEWGSCSRREAQTGFAKDSVVSRVQESMTRPLPWAHGCSAKARPLSTLRRPEPHEYIMLS